MKKILIIYGPLSQKHLVDAIIAHCSCETFSLTGFNSSDWTFNGLVDTIPSGYRIVKSIFRKGKVRNFLWKLFFTRVLIKISTKYDAIDITYFDPRYFHFLNYLKSNNKPYKITFWGSDFYRADNKTLMSMNNYLKNAKIIQVETESIKSDVAKIFPDIVNKVSVCNYGIDLFEIIDNHRRAKNVESKLNSKIVITCGYNGSRGQQHIKIINAISQLPREVKDQIFINLPMTYGIPNQQYLLEVITAMDRINIGYKIFDTRLTEDELAELRLQSGIVVNIQTTDAFSSSLIEHLYAGSILIVGDWLPYSIYSDFGIKYYKTTVDDLSEKLEQVISNYQNVRDEFSCNINAAKNMSSWDCKKEQLISTFYSLI